MSEAQLDKTVIWRGFEHNWTYNHRLNRIGDYVQMNNGSPESCHASATGYGADSTHYTSHYTLIQSETLGFQEGVSSFKIVGKEGNLVTQTFDISVPADDNLLSKENYTVLLNGFDLRSELKADKIQLFRVHLSSGSFAPSLNEVHFQVQISLVFNCQSLECSRLSQKAIYNFEMHYLVIGGNEDEYTSNEHLFTKDYVWSKRDETYPAPIKHTIKGVKNSEFKTATLGVKSLSISLDKSHWMIQWNSNIIPLEYNIDKGTQDFKLDLLFKEWSRFMKGRSATPGKSAFSARKKGWVAMDMNVVFMQFKDAEVMHLKQQGSMYWKGNNKKAISDGSKVINKIVLPRPKKETTKVSNLRRLD